MIIYDISASLHACVYGLIKMKEAPDLDNLRIRVLDTIAKTNQKLFGEYGREVVIACDNKSWRKLVFPLYKFKRAEKKEKEVLDWDDLHQSFSTILEEIKSNFPYKVINVGGCEGDDVIGIIANNIRDKKICIVSRDKDFYQLMKNSNIRIYDPMLKKFLEQQDYDYYLFYHIIKGDEKDGIPNIYSPNDFFVNKSKGQRQKSIYEKNIRALYEMTVDDFKLALSETEYQRYLQNQMLIDFNYIPKKIQGQVMDKFDNYEIVGNNVYKYLKSMGLTQFYQDINYF